MQEIRDNSSITTAELAKILQISETVVDNNLAFLKENLYIKRGGSKKKERWQVLEEKQ